MGVQLLDRSTRPLSLTQEGRLYQDLSRDVLRRHEEFETSLHQLRTRMEGTVRVASIYSVGLSEMSEVEEKLHRRLPGVRLEIDYLRPEKVYEAVAEDRADVGLVSFPEARREIAVIPWRHEVMVLATPPGHPLAGRDRIQPSDLEDAEFISFDDDLPIAREISRYFRTHDVTVRSTMHFDNIQTIKEAVMHGSAVSIVPSRILRAEVASGRIGAIPLDRPLYRPLGVIHRKRKRFAPAIQGFLEILQETNEVSRPDVKFAGS